MIRSTRWAGIKRRRDLAGRDLSAIVWLLLVTMPLLAGLGCKGDETLQPSAFVPADATGQAKSDSPSARSSPPGTSESVSDAVSSSSSTSSSSQPARPPTFRHPLDEVPEGKLYREVLRAMDEGDVGPAEQFQARWADHPQFGVLAQAVRAMLMAQRGELDEALRIAEQVSAVPIMRAESFMIAGDVFRRQGRWGDAIGLFRQALESHPDHVRAHRWLGALYHDTGAMQLAIDHLHRVAELDPSDYRAPRLAGLIHREYEKFPDAVEDYEETLRRSPPELVELEVRMELARAHLALRQMEEALESLEPTPAIAEVLALRAAILETQGEVDEARGMAERAVSLAPQHAEANLVLGRLALAERDWERAREHLERVVEQKPTDHEPRFLLGRALLNSGSEDEGRRQLERATELREKFLALAELHLDAMSRPDDVEVRVRLGELAEKLAWNRVALTWYEAARGLDPENAEALRAIDRLREKLGELQSR